MNRNLRFQHLIRYERKVNTRATILCGIDFYMLVFWRSIRAKSTQSKRSTHFYLMDRWRTTRIILGSIHRHRYIEPKIGLVYQGNVDLQQLTKGFTPEKSCEKVGILELSVSY